MSFRIIGLGEILWDIFPGGRQLGGAPANFAYHATALGAEGRIISRVGNDSLGREILDRIAALKLPTDSIEIDPDLPTGTVTVTLDGAGHPQYVIHEPVAWDRLAGQQAAREAVAQADAICFGTLAQRAPTSRATIRSLLNRAPPSALRIFDINLRQNYYSAELIEESLALANILKVNETELPIIGAMFEMSGRERELIPQLAERFKLRLVAFTRGDKGSLLYAQGQWSDHAGVPTKVVDTVGAGDSFTATLAVGLLGGKSLDQINEHANQVASFVAGSSGATPALPERLRAFK